MPLPTTEVTTERGVYRFYAVMGCDNGHSFIAPPYTTTAIDCPKCEENRKAVHEQSRYCKACGADTNAEGSHDAEHPGLSEILASSNS